MSVRFVYSHTGFSVIKSSLLYAMMKRLIFFLVLLISPSCFSLLSAQTPFPEGMLVNPLAGAEDGAFFPGACSPFGMVKLGPDVVRPSFGTGYTAHGLVSGFSHTHFAYAAKPGIYGSILVSPQVGKPDFRKRTLGKASGEVASPGYFSASYGHEQDQIRVELTANQNIGRHRYTFRPGKTGRFPAAIWVDAGANISTDPKQAFLGSQVSAGTDGSFRGSARFGKVGNAFEIWFEGQINLKNARVLYKIDTTRLPAKKIKVDTAGFCFYGEVNAGEEVEVTIAISYKNGGEAASALRRAISQNFDDIKKKTGSAWQDYLAVISFPMAGEPERELVYNALYRSILSPTDVSGNHPEDQFGEAQFWDFLSNPDLADALFPFHTLVYGSAQRRILNSLVRISDKVKHIPGGWVAGSDAAGGSSAADCMLAEAVAQKFLTGPDASKAWKAVYDQAITASARPGVFGYPGFYLRHGYLHAGFDNSVRRSLELAATDFAISQMAATIGKIAEAEFFRKRSLGVLQLWSPSAKGFFSKDSVGNWSQLVPTKEANLSSVPVPPHLADTVQKWVGKSGLMALFDTSGQSFPPSGLLILGDRALNNRVLKRWQARSLQTEPESSALNNILVIWGSLGLFPVKSTESYALLSPPVSAIELSLSGGKVLIIKGKGSRPYWKGKELKSAFLPNSEMLAGGTLEWK